MPASLLYFTQSGDGNPVIFLHGFLESSTMWEYLDLSQLNRHCIFVDLPGHGNSKLLNEVPPSIERLADELLEIIDALQLKSYAVVGHSMGGYVGLQLMKKDKRVQHLVLLNSNFWSDSEEKKIDRRRVAEIVYKAKDFFLQEAIPNLFLDPKTCDAEVERLIKEAKQMEPDAIAYASLAMAEREDLSEFVLKHQERVSILQGAEDPIVLKDKMDNSLRSQRNYCVIQNSGHMSHIEQPEMVLNYLRDCL